jgi:hypothetical protein
MGEMSNTKVNRAWTLVVRGIIGCGTMPVKTAKQLLRGFHACIVGERQPGNITASLFKFAH